MLYWFKFNSLYRLGYKQHTRTDEEGYIEKLHITHANTHECNHLLPLLEGIAEGTIYADIRREKRGYLARKQPKTCVWVSAVGEKKFCKGLRPSESVAAVRRQLFRRPFYACFPIRLLFRALENLPCVRCAGHV